MSGYKTQLPIGDYKFVKKITEIFRKIVQQELSKAQLPKLLPATIVTVGSGVADIKLNGSSTTIPDVMIGTGLTLNPNDQVYVLLIYGSASNMFIIEKKP